jgi:hypothetical protein
MLCLAPLLLLGYAQTIQTDWHSSKDISNPYVEIQTCKDGLGGEGRKKLVALEAAGVDNWEWYGDAMDTLNEEGE